MHANHRIELRHADVCAGLCLLQGTGSEGVYLRVKLSFAELMSPFSPVKKDGVAEP